MFCIVRILVNEVGDNTILFAVLAKGLIGFMSFLPEIFLLTINPRLDNLSSYATNIGFIPQVFYISQV